MIEENFDINEVARALKMNPFTVRTYARRFPQYWHKINYEWRISKSNYDKWFQEMKTLRGKKMA